jgi:hypothetical protein
MGSKIHMDLVFPTLGGGGRGEAGCGKGESLI